MRSDTCRARECLVTLAVSLRCHTLGTAPCHGDCHFLHVTALSGAPETVPWELLVC